MRATHSVYNSLSLSLSLSLSKSISFIGRILHVPFVLQLCNRNYRAGASDCNTNRTRHDEGTEHNFAKLAKNKRNATWAVGLVGGTRRRMGNGGTLKTPQLSTHQNRLPRDLAKPTGRAGGRIIINVKIFAKKKEKNRKNTLRNMENLLMALDCIQPGNGQLIIKILQPLSA